MKPIKVALIWHFHQPYYKKEKEFMLPWVRLHGIKDYFSLPELFQEFPNVKQTINLVPSLRMQLDEYIEGTCEDKIQRLTKIPAVELSECDKEDILRLFFLCNHENMLNPYPRYKELLDRSSDKIKALKEFSQQDWRDLQVWYNLTWLDGYSRNHKAVRRLFDKGRDFAEEEKIAMLEMHKYILSQIRPQLKMLQTTGQLEISCTPMYHPILPLLCDSNVASESMPDIELPKIRFKYPQDAEWQIASSLEYFAKSSGRKLYGMWPSEGSISNEVLDLMIKAGVQWAASDEEVLKKSLMPDYKHTHKYFPRKYLSENGSIALLFRDHSLSDAIGFVYSRWNAYDAAIDFTNKLKHIRSEIINEHGEDALDHAAVPVILDGENCWEFYYENGIHFQRSLYDILSNDGTFLTVTPSEAIQAEHTEYLPTIKSIRAGSWINADFRIWIGNRQNREAWSMLARARETIEKAKESVDLDKYQKALNEIYIAEGSDWFWWYCDDHQASNKYDFDMLFRWHLEQAYKLIGQEVPNDIFIPIHTPEDKTIITPQKNLISPRITGLNSTESDWPEAGCYDAEKSLGSMHFAGAILKKLLFGSNKEKIFSRLVLSRKLKNEEKIEINVSEPNKYKIIIKNHSSCIHFFSKTRPYCIELASYEVIDIALDKLITEKMGSSTCFADISINVITENSNIVYPLQGSLFIEFI